MKERLSIITLVNNQALYELSRRTLQAQSEADDIDFIPVYADKEGWNAATGYNHGIENARTQWVACIHQDVLFPPGWFVSLRENLRRIPDDTAVIGLVGRTRDGAYRGHIADPHGHSRWTPLPSVVMTVDEHAIILQKETPVRFDHENPGFHVYGADICMEAQNKGFVAMTIDSPVIHLSGGKIDPSFDQAADWLLTKWGRYANYVIPLCAALPEKRLIQNLPRRWLVTYQRRRSLSSRHACDCAAVSLPRELIDKSLISSYAFIENLLVKERPAAVTR